MFNRSLIAPSLSFVVLTLALSGCNGLGMTARVPGVGQLTPSTSVGQLTARSTISPSAAIDGAPAASPKADTPGASAPSNGDVALRFRSQLKTLTEVTVTIDRDRLRLNGTGRLRVKPGLQSFAIELANANHSYRPDEIRQFVIDVKDFAVNEDTEFQLLEGNVTPATPEPGYKPFACWVDRPGPCVNVIRVVNNSRHPICEMNAKPIRHEGNFADEDYVRKVGKMEPGESRTLRLRRPGPYRLRIVNCDKAFIYRSEEFEAGTELVLFDGGKPPKVASAPGFTKQVAQKTKVQPCNVKGIRAAANKCDKITDPARREACKEKTRSEWGNVGSYADCRDF
jgi:hypothetical protein